MTGRSRCIAPEMGRKRVEKPSLAAARVEKPSLAAAGVEKPSLKAWLVCCSRSEGLGPGCRRKTGPARGEGKPLMAAAQPPRATQGLGNQGRWKFALLAVAAAEQSGYFHMSSTSSFHKRSVTIFIVVLNTSTGFQEHLYNIYIASSTSISLIRQCLTRFNSMKTERRDEATEEKFEASTGWPIRLKERSCLHNIKIQGEHKNPPQNNKKEIEVGGRYLKYLANEGCYKTALHWKKMTSKTFIARKETSMPDFKASNDKLTPLLGVNAAGYLK
ncbi:hypothetical protein QTO34_008315 [Cnephaeus nilssonii]|uniref:Uncharacterized protein n=1 Tax=Cnephaeus nilssonii TaxID=3371016 RepID=A0AA40IA96_CNENI|nr:hypothetical protein QTO34_008315 [Eptesicus nilssonii]